MMNCAEIENLTADYLGDELDADGRAEFEAHLRECVSCQANIAEFQATLNELEHVATVPLAVAAQRTSALRLPANRGPVHRLVLATLKAAAVLAVGIAIGRASVGVEPKSAEPPGQPSAPPAVVADADGMHPEWIKLGREVESGRSTFATQMMVLARSGKH